MEERVHHHPIVADIEAGFDDPWVVEMQRRRLLSEFDSLSEFLDHVITFIEQGIGEFIPSIAFVVGVVLSPFRLADLLSHMDKGDAEGIKNRFETELAEI